MFGIIRDVMVRFRQGDLSTTDAIGELGLSRSRFYVLYADYLRSCARRCQRSWAPGHSGGNHHPAWPSEVCELLRKLLGARPPAPYAFAAPPNKLSKPLLLIHSPAPTPVLL